MNPKERKQMAMQRLDQLYSGMPQALPETPKKKDNAKWWLKGFVGIAQLGVGTFVIFQFVIPMLKDAMVSMTPQAQGSLNTIIDVIPIMVGASVLLFSIGIMGGSKEEEDGA